MDENITRFDISVHDIILHQHFKRFQKFLKVSKGLFLTQVPTIFDQIFEGASIAEFIHKVNIVGCFQYLNETHDMGGVLNLRESLNLVDGEFLQSGTHFIFLDFDDFDGHGLVGFLVCCLVHFSKLSFPDDLLQAVVFYFFPHSAVRFTIYICILN